MHGIAIIPARGGSRGVPGKNLLRIGGLPLIGRSILAAREAKGLDGIYVSTDDAGIARMARRFGAEVIDRPAALAGDTASSEAALLHGLDVLAARGIRPDRLVMLQCTSPFTTGEDIDRCLAALDAPGVACALSVVPDHGFLWTLGPDGLGRGINHDETATRPLRQTLSRQYRENGAVYAMQTAAFRAVGRRFCGGVAPVAVAPLGPEIDEPADLMLCQTIAAGLPRFLLPARIRALAFTGPHATVANPGRLALINLQSETLAQAAMRQGYALDEFAYLGETASDLEAIDMAGWSIAPASAPKAIQDRSHLIIDPGPIGALDWLIARLDDGAPGRDADAVDSPWRAAEARTADDPRAETGTGH